MSLINVDDKELATLRVKAALADWFWGPFNEEEQAMLEANPGAFYDPAPKSKADILAKVLEEGYGAWDEADDLRDCQATYDSTF